MWAHHVQRASDAQTAEDFELRYAKARGKVHLSRGLWSRYLRGETIPQSAVTRSDRSLIKRLDDEFSGTGDIFVHPIWTLLDFQHLLGPDQLLENYLHLDEQVWQKFVDCSEQTDDYKPPRLGPFWSVSLESSRRKYRLSHLSGFDGIAACLIECRMGYLSQVEERFITSMLASKKHFKQLSETEPFQSRRAQAALLAMEGYCVAYLERVSIAASNNGSTYALFRSKIWEWQDMWRDRCLAHFARLTPGSLVTFKIWLRTAVATNPDSPGPVKRDSLSWLK